MSSASANLALLPKYLMASSSVMVPSLGTPIWIVNRGTYSALRHPFLITEDGNRLHMDEDERGLLSIPISALPGQRIRALRLTRGMDQKALAKAAGIRPPSLSQLESGKSKKLKGSTLLGIAAALKANPDWINTGRGAPFQTAVAGPEEQELLAIYRAIPQQQQAAFVAMARGLYNAAPGGPTVIDAYKTNKVTVEEK